MTGQSLILLGRITINLPFLSPDYSNYTLKMINEEEFGRGSAFRRLQGTSQGTQEVQVGFTTEMMQVINAQNLLIMKLLHRQNLLYKELAQRLPSSDSGSSNDKPHHPPSQDANNQQSSSNSQRSPNSCPPQKPTSLIVYPRPSRPVRKMESSEEQAEEEGYAEGQSDFRDEPGRIRQPETKNMIKNFAKAIFSFISKHADYRAKVLATIGAEQPHFMAILNRNRGRVHSIAELRGLWTREDTFGRAFRIFSEQYLRRHCLAKTFNSRVQNYGVHLKYRQRLRWGLRSPQEFTSLKTD